MKVEAGFFSNMLCSDWEVPSLVSRAGYLSQLRRLAEGSRFRTVLFGHFHIPELQQLRHLGRKSVISSSANVVSCTGTLLYSKIVTGNRMYLSCTACPQSHVLQHQQHCRAFVCVNVFCAIIFRMRCTHHIHNTKEVTDGLPTDLSEPLGTLAARSPRFAAALDGGKPIFCLV